MERRQLPKTREHEPKGDLPRMPDQNGCIPTAVAHALSRLGRKTTPREIDRVLKRPRGKLPSKEGEIELSRWLLERGNKVEYIYKPGSVSMLKYFEEGSTLTYADYRQELRGIQNRKLARSIVKWHRQSNYYEDAFNKDMANRREKSKEFDRFRRNGQYVEGEKKITPESLQALVDSGASVVLSLHFEDYYQGHAVVLEDIAREKGMLAVTVFNPGVDESHFETFRAGSLEKLFDFDNHVMVIR